MRASFFFFNDTATTEIYTLSLHDALPICPGQPHRTIEHVAQARHAPAREMAPHRLAPGLVQGRSEEHTSELQSLAYLVCRLLLEKKKQTRAQPYYRHTLARSILRD